MDKNTKKTDGRVSAGRGGPREGAGRKPKPSVRLSGKISLEADAALRELEPLFRSNRTAVIEAAIEALHGQKKADGSL